MNTSSKSIFRVTSEFIADEKAAEVTELAIVLGLIVAGCVVSIVALGPKVKTFYDNVNADLP